MIHKGKFGYGLQWYMIGTRKEEQRRLNRLAGRLKFRGSKADGSALLDGMFLCEVHWRGDQPILKKPAPGTNP